MKLTEAKDVLKNHLLCLSGKMVSKPKQKDVIEALQTVIESIDVIKCDHLFRAVWIEGNGCMKAQCCKCGLIP